MKTTNRGFTIVELLIVIVVIAILAVITIVAFNGVQQRSRASSLASSLSQAKKKLELYKVDNGSYPVTGNLTGAGVVNSGSTYYQYTSDGVTFCVTASTGGTSYNMTESGTSSSGSCSGQMDGGMLTNLVSDPSFENGLAGTLFNNNGTTGNRAAVAAAARYGSNGQRYTVTGGLFTNNVGPYIQVYNLSPTKSYTASALVRASSAKNYHLQMERRNSSGTSLGAVVSSDVALTPNTWTRLSMTIPVTANMERLTFCVYSGNSTFTVGDTVDYDGLMLTEGTNVYEYADGSSTGWTWNGTPNSSTSTGPAL